MKLTVGDLFAGAGGFAEGFRQAGFRIAWAIDNWEPAARTFEKNLPGRMIHADLLDFPLDELAPVDVLIGSPPCTQFSLANRGGNGNKALGMKYVMRFFEVARRLRPKYWIMENVPNLFREIELLLAGDDAVQLPKGDLGIPHRQVLLASDYGVPQSRKRLFCGRYPVPKKAKSSSLRSRITLGSVLKGIPPPCHPTNLIAKVQDPVYPSLRIPISKLGGQFEDSRWSLTDEEIDWCRRQKTKHAVYGVMSFPDRLDLPARTITSTRTHTSRSTILVPCRDSIHSDGIIRTLTARECASVQAFPLSYQFWGNSISDVDKMIGNAVPPALGFAFAKAILSEQGVEAPESPDLTREFEPAPQVFPRPRRSLRYSIGRRFRGVCECEWSPDARVELDNSGEDPGRDSVIDAPFLKEWVTRVYLGYAKKYKGYELASTQVDRIIERVCRSWPEGRIIESSFQNLKEDAIRTFAGKLPDASGIQAIWSGRGTPSVSPSNILRAVDRLVDLHLNKKEWTRTPIPGALYATTLTRTVIGQGSLAEPGCPRDLTVRMLGALLALCIACDEVNRRPTRLVAFRGTGVPLIRLPEGPATLGEARVESQPGGR